MMRIPIGYILLSIGIAFCMAIGFGGLWLYDRSQFRSERELLSQIAEQLSEKERRESEIPPTPEPVNPHADTLSKIEQKVGVPLSRISALIIRDEGEKPKPYLDPSGNVTIGIGRNLKGNGISIDELRAIQGEIDSELLFQSTTIRNGRIYISTMRLANEVFLKPLTAHDIQLLLVNDLAEVVASAEKVFPENWRRLDPIRREVIVDLMFNLGFERFKGFVKFIAAVKAMDWKLAASELLKSTAAHQNPTRYYRNSVVIATGDSNILESKKR